MREQLQQTLGSAYTLERELGGGGMSRVFVAEETTLERKVVIKVLPPELAAAVNLKRFKREIQLAAKLQHPNIVAVLAAGVTEGLPYYTMPFVEGDSLRARIAREGELPINEVVKILRDVLAALAYAHGRGIVHRDIKPDNVLLTKYNAQVTDFGIAKALTESTAAGSLVTSLGVALGTPAYMAPEQVAADPMTDHRADIYSVGAMAYEMLTGSPLFGSRTPQATMAAHAIERPESLELRRPSVPPVLSGLVMRALEKHAADRPQSAEEMLSVLDSLTTPWGGMAPTSGAYASAAVKKPSRRGMLAGAVAALLISGIGSILYFQRDRSAAAVQTDQPRLAVLPFENGGAPADAYFAEGMTEAITNRLASISGLTVIGRQSAKRYVGSDKTPQQIGSELGVNYLLTGSVRWDKSQPGRNVVSIRPALLKVVDGTQLWAEPYDAVLAGEFKLQSDVAERVAQALDVKLMPHETRSLATKPTSDPAAYDAYLRGRYFWNKRTAAGTTSSIEYFGDAVKRDPQFARAYASLAEAYVILPDYADAEPKPSYRIARTYAAKAIALDSTLGSPHATIAALFDKQHRWVEAEREFKRAIELEPNYPTTHHWYARMLMATGKVREAVLEAQRARTLDPLSVIINQNLAMTQIHSRDYDTAEATLRSALTLDPANGLLHWMLGQVFTAKGQYSKAISEMDTAIARVDDKLGKTSWTAMREYIVVKSGDTVNARKVLDAAKRVRRIEFAGSEIALLHLALAEPDSALSWVRKYTSDYGDFLVLRSPFFDPLKTDPRFVALLRHPPQLQ